jgi:hypothetical protein
MDVMLYELELPTFHFHHSLKRYAVNAKVLTYIRDPGRVWAVRFLSDHYPTSGVSRGYKVDEMVHSSI